MPRIPRVTGTIKSIIDKKGFGFIVADASADEYFFHYTGCATVQFAALRQGTRVSFIPSETPKGPRAEAIELA